MPCLCHLYASKLSTAARTAWYISFPTSRDRFCIEHKNPGAILRHHMEWDDDRAHIRIDL